MDNFLVGQLVKNVAGTVHENSVLDRVLTLYHCGRTTMPIYDKPLPISMNLPERKTYEMIVVVTNFQLLRIPIIPFDSGRLGTWHATVIDPKWSAPENAYHYVRPSLYRRQGKKRTWILIATPLGNMLINPVEFKREIGFAAQKGDPLRWQESRFDLWAVALRS